MEKIFYQPYRVVLILTFLLLTVIKTNSQTTMPVELNNNTIKEQLTYIEGHTRIYENYRAIREDIFQKLVVNVNDSISQSARSIAELKILTTVLKNNIDSVTVASETINTKLDDLARTKNSIRFLGIEVDKLVYNSIMWTIVAGLIVLLVIGLLLFKRNLMIIINTKKELKAFIAEFEAYRKTSQQARDQLYADHFNELKKLRGK
jgi:hypothetical protein